MTFPKFRTSSPPPTGRTSGCVDGTPLVGRFCSICFPCQEIRSASWLRSNGIWKLRGQFFLCTIWFCAYLVGKTYRNCATVLVSQVRTYMAGSYGGLANCYPDISPLVALPSKLVGTTFLCLPTGAVDIIFTRLLHTP